MTKLKQKAAGLFFIFAGILSYIIDTSDGTMLVLFGILGLYLCFTKEKIFYDTKVKK